MVSFRQFLIVSALLTGCADDKPPTEELTATSGTEGGAVGVDAAGADADGAGATPDADAMANVAAAPGADLAIGFDPAESAPPGSAAAVAPQYTGSSQGASVFNTTMTPEGAAQSGEVLFVFVDSAAVRAAPKEDASLSRKLDYGEKVHVLDRADGFIKITGSEWVLRTDLTDRRTGFAAADEIWYVKHGDIEVRAEPMGDATVVGKLTRGDRFFGKAAKGWVEVDSGRYVQTSALSHAVPKAAR